MNAILPQNTTRRRPNSKPKVTLDAITKFREGICGSETKLQNLVLRHLRPLEDALGFRVIHIPNGGKRSAKSGAHLKHMGLRKGFPDLMILAGTDIRRCTPTIFIELKQPDDAKPDPEQLEWHTWLNDMLFPVYVCTSLQSVLTALRSHGIQV